MGKKFFSSDMIVGMVAFMVSIGTLFTFIYQTNIMRKHQRASVLPYIEIWNTTNGNERYELNLYNNGVGPAFIKGIKVITEDSVFHGDPDLFMRSLRKKTDTLDVRYGCSNIKEGRLIRAGEKVTMIGAFKDSADVITLRKIFTRKAQVEITFSSIYDEVWVTRGTANPPVKVK